mgnify:CR=1 FL=1
MTLNSSAQDLAFSKLKDAFTLTDTTGNERIAPRFAGMRQSQFMRYYEHPDFADLGFTPYANMEEYYNANSTMWDDMGRMWGQYTSLAGAGFCQSTVCGFVEHPIKNCT